MFPLDSHSWPFFHWRSHEKKKQRTKGVFSTKAQAQNYHIIRLAPCHRFRSVLCHNVEYLVSNLSSTLQGFQKKFTRWQGMKKKEKRKLPFSFETSHKRKLSFIVPLLCSLSCILFFVFLFLFEIYDFDIFSVWSLWQTQHFLLCFTVECRSISYCQFCDRLVPKTEYHILQFLKVRPPLPNTVFSW